VSFQRFLGGFTGTEGVGTTFDIPCGYICTIGFDVLDFNIEHADRYVLVAGKLEKIREDIYELATREEAGPPCFEFEGSREGWYYRNAGDSGWPVRGMLDIRPTAEDFSLIGPDISIQVSDVMQLELNGSMGSGSGSVYFLWSRISGSEKLPPDSLLVPFKPGEDVQTCGISLSEAEGFEGLVTGFRFHFHGFCENERVRIESICLK
jgi:hypothetical protein